VGPSDVPRTGAICLNNGSRIGTVDQSGEAFLIGGTPISKYSPPGLKQRFAPSFFKTLSLRPAHKYSGIGHETAQQNQAAFLNDKTWIIPLKVFQILNKKGEVTAEVVGGRLDCVKFTTSLTATPSKVPAPTAPYLPPPPVKSESPVAPPVIAKPPVPVAPPVKTESPVAPPVKTEPPTPVIVLPSPVPKIPRVTSTPPPAAGPSCKFVFCSGPIQFTVGKSSDIPFTGKICRNDGTLIGTIDESGEAWLEGGTPISKYSPPGLAQKFSPNFFRTAPIKATKYVYSGIAHQLPQLNQGKFLNGKTWILPVKAYQVLNRKGDVTAELVGGKYDCIKFSTRV